MSLEAWPKWTKGWGKSGPARQRAIGTRTSLTELKRQLNWTDKQSHENRTTRPPSSQENKTPAEDEDRDTLKRSRLLGPSSPTSPEKMKKKKLFQLSVFSQIFPCRPQLPDEFSDSLSADRGDWFCFFFFFFFFFLAVHWLMENGLFCFRFAASTSLTPSQPYIT